MKPNEYKNTYIMYHETTKDEVQLRAPLEHEPFETPISVIRFLET